MKIMWVLTCASHEVVFCMYYTVIVYA